MSNRIRIHPKNEYLIRGTTVPVEITLEVEQPVKARGLHARFHGAEETKANYTTYNAATKTTDTHTAVEHITIVESDYLLAGNERKGFFGNLADGVATMFGGGEHEVIQPGIYSFDVEVALPDDARPSFQGQKCRVFYELSARVDVPLGFDLKAIQSFRVSNPKPPIVQPRQPVRTRYPEDQGRGLLDSWFGPELQVEAGLSSSVFRQGDTISGVFRIDTTESLEIRRIDVRLLGVEKTQASGHSDQHAHQLTPHQVATPGAVQFSYKQDFSFPVDLQGPPTTSGQRFTVDWYVQIELDVPWAKNPKIRVPITIDSVA